MIKFSELCFMMLFLPFLAGYIHLKIKGNLVRSSLVYYRYFVFLNVIFASVVVAARVFLESQQVPEVESSIYDFYAIAVLSIMITALFTLFSRHQLMLASAVNWIAFVVLSTIMHFVLLGMQEDGDTGIAWVHIIYNIIVVFILFALMARVKRTFKRVEHVSYEAQQVGSGH